MDISMIGLYVLDGRTPVPVNDNVKWGQWFKGADRLVAIDKVGNAEVKTMFLGIDHDFLGTGPPILFETFVDGGTMEETQDFYTTWEEAELGHTRMVEAVRASLT